MAYVLKLLNRCTVRYFGRNATTVTTPTPINLSTTLKLYDNTKIKPKYFRIIVIVSGVQLVLWSYLSYYALTEFGKGNRKKSHGGQTTAAEVTSKKGNSSSPESLTSWFASSKWRIGLSLLSLGAGLFFAVTACMYPMRIVRKLTLLRTDQALQFVTFTPMGTTRVLQVPITDVRCASSEKQKASGSHIALKVKDHSLYFLLDQQETYLNPLLYTLVGRQTKD